MLQKTLQRQTLRSQSHRTRPKGTYTPFLFRFCCYYQFLAPVIKHTEFKCIVKKKKKHIADKESYNSTYTNSMTEHSKQVKTNVILSNSKL